MRKETIRISAIIGTAIVVLSSVYYAVGFEHSTTLPTIQVGDSVGYSNLSANFDNTSSSAPLLKNWTFSSTTLVQSGYRNSTLRSGLGIGNIFYDGPNANLFMQTSVKVSGTLFLSHLPASVNVRYKISTFSEGSVGWAFFDPVNVTEKNPPSYNYSEPLLNGSANKTSPYHFSFIGDSSFTVVPQGKDVPFNVTATVSLIGLSKPVYVTVVLTLIDTGNKFGNGSLGGNTTALSTSLAASISGSATIIPYQTHGYDGTDAVYMTTANSTSNSWTFSNKSAAGFKNDTG